MAQLAERRERVMYEIDKKCQKCKNNGTVICNRCDMFYDEFEPIDRAPQTNADRIRSMSDEALAGKFEEVQLEAAKAYGNDDMLLVGELRKYWLDWLRKEAE